jgi:hypothetical protein
LLFTGSMLQFAISDTSAEVIVTLSEKVTIDNPFYHFVFTHVTTKDVVTITKDSADDESGYTSRYNKYTINPSVIFAGKRSGHWLYEVYQRSTEDGANGDLLESGKLDLQPATTFTYTEPALATTFKTYGG